MDLSIESGNSSSNMLRKGHKKQKNFVVVIILLSVFCVSLLIPLIILLVRNSPANASNCPHNVCETSDCIAAAKYLSASIDLSVDPCENFYAFTCNKWEENNPVPENQIEVRASSILKAKMDNSIAALFNVNVHDSKDKLIRDTLNYYQACMNTAQIDETGDKDIKEFLDKFVRAPLLHDDFDPDNFNWLKSIGRVLKATGTPYIISWSLNPDVRDSNKFIIGLDKPANFFLIESLDNFDSEKAENERKVVKKFIIELFTLLNGSKDKNDIASQVDGIIEFELAIYNLAPKKSRDRLLNPILNMTTLQDQLPGVDWLEFMKTITDEALTPLNSLITESEEIELYNKLYLERLITFMSDSTRKSQAANYMAWQVILTRVLLLPKPFRDAHIIFYADHPSLNQSLPARSKSCLAYVRQAFPEVVIYLYIQHYLPPKSKAKTEEMVRSLFDQFETMLKDSDWMDAQTTKKAISKLQHMDMQVGYPNWLSSLEKIEKIYSSMKGDIQNDAFKNLLIIQEFQFHMAVTKLRKTASQLEANLNGILSVDATYFRNWNSILISAGMLQSPFYYSHAPWFLNYGAVGTILAHEMTHGFDILGRERDENGKFENWWSVNATLEYEERMQCLISQYDSYKVNGTASLIENTADNGGLRLAYYAYKEHSKEFQAEAKLQDFTSFTVDQLFFISYGTIMCHNVKEGVTIEPGNYSPNEYRLMGSLANLRQFSDAFKCKSNTLLNPDKRCELW